MSQRMKHKLCNTIAQLKAIRAGKHISQRELSLRLGMAAPQLLQSYEQGRNCPSIRRVEEIAEALGCEIVVKEKSETKIEPSE